MFTFLNKAKNHTSLDWLGVDIHSHLLPGIDDGSPDVETSLTYVDRLEALGLRHFYATPHIYMELYPNTAATIQSALDRLRQQLPPGVQLEAAAEYMVDDTFETRFTDGKKLMTLPGNHVLIEMSYIAENARIERIIFELQVHGYKPVLAHPERYLFYHGHLGRYEQLKRLGCLFQMNILSPTGYYNPQVKKAAQYLLKRGMVDFVGTDLHHQKHLTAIEKFVLSGEAHGAFKKNPIKNSALIT
ncbi:capsular polysaccharide biosynthesis protein [Parapedobacter pyrenivorans]|uniref:protein-tyrosine-phosphatase n=1 Tax=Parapedobacter pyrenivorans TaxID=1305674 RepID=A0A917HL53_9SPHI|nr:CpsB/CapC family capsule biosynthesis tyrosine phosphatase [Parapedobacter pyrenivorans]GGG83194.1 capsular polysaccharide biosynthesis protein [Parapedobacter pyrenivorans]